MAGNEFAGDLIPVFIMDPSAGTGKREIIISQRATVDELTDLVRETLSLPRDLQEVKLVFTNRVLADRNKTLKDYGIQRESSIWCFTRAHGGI